MFIFVVDAHFIVQDGVEAHVAEVGDCLDRVQILEIALSQRQNRAAGPKHFFPEMWERGRRTVRVNSHLRLRRRNQRPEAKDQNKARDSHTSITSRLRTT